MPALQQTLYRQLCNKPLPEAAKTDSLIALGELKAVAKDIAVLLVIVHESNLSSPSTEPHTAHAHATRRCLWGLRPHTTMQPPGA